MAFKGSSGAPLDLVLLDDISEKSIVKTLTKHYSANDIYVFIGPTLISMNPYKLISGLYGSSKIKKYVSKKDYENPPHVYSIAERAYRNMMLNFTSECVVITGESGSGKTENSKKVMEYVAAMASKSKEVQKVKEQLLESNPLLESFGNAKTLRNDNSSRFGKYMEILFTYGDPSGGRITTYLLEKSRVVKTNEGERNFHVFYQLLEGAGSSTKSKLQLGSANDFRYTSQSGCTTVKGMNDSKEYADTLKAMEWCGISSSEQEQVWRIVAGILHLGNIDFDGSRDGCKPVGSSVPAAAQQLGLSPKTLMTGLTTRDIRTRGESISKPLTPKEAEGARDSLARSLYGKLFDWIVESANNAIRSERHSSSIGVLDIFGFEILKGNEFEQLCINFTNEKLHQLFIELTLRAEQQEYKNEGIQWEEIDYVDNLPVVTLIEGKHQLFDLLNEESIFPNGTDESLFNKLKSNLSRKKEFQIPQRAGPKIFEIRHYAGVVEYTTAGMLEKNKDTLFPNLIDMMNGSNCEIASKFFENEASSGRATQRPETTCVQYKRSMNQLMKTLGSAEQHYIRCIKPNDVKTSGVFEAEMVKEQVRYLGLLENIKVRRAGYAFRLEFERFLAKYKAVNNSFEWVSDARRGTEQILRSARVKDYQMGKTKVFIRSPKSIFLVEDQRKHFLEDAASYLPEGDGLIFADKVMGLNNHYQRSPLMFVVGGEGFYLFNLRKDGEATNEAAAHYFPMDQVDNMIFNDDQGWTVINTKPFPGKYEDDPKIVLSYLVENLFGFEVENFVEILGQMGVDIRLTKSSGNPPTESKDPRLYESAVKSIGKGEIRRAARGAGNRGGGGGGCCIIC